MTILAHIHIIAYNVHTNSTVTLEDQIECLVERGYPDMVGLGADQFRRRLGALAAYLPASRACVDTEAGKIDFVLVVHGAMAPAEKTLPLVVREGRTAFEKLFPRNPGYFRTLDSAGVPAGHAYLLLDIDRGNGTLNVVPKEGQSRIAAEGRFPLTIHEGIAILTQYADFLQPNHCFMMLGSRGDDKRVPALWLSGKTPKLGWCWEGNPHTWLGFASCQARSPAVSLFD